MDFKYKILIIKVFIKILVNVIRNNNSSLNFKKFTIILKKKPIIKIKKNINLKLKLRSHINLNNLNIKKIIKIL